MIVHVAVSDPLPMYRKGVMAILTDAGFQSEAPDDLLTWIRDEQRKVVLLTLQSAEDWTLLAELRRTGDDLLIVAAVNDITTPTYVRALTAGAVSVVPRDASPDAVREALEAAIHGRSVLPAEVVRALTVPELVSDSPGLSPSSPEIEWLHNLAKGVPIRQLASQVGYSERMMFRLLRELYDRLGVSNRTEALILARDRGWL